MKRDLNTVVKKEKLMKASVMILAVQQSVYAGGHQNQECMIQSAFFVTR